MPAKSTDSTPPPAISPANDPVLVRYMSEVQRVFGSVRFIGLGSARESHTGTVPLERIFVHPDLLEDHLSPAESVHPAHVGWEKKAVSLLQTVRSEQRLVILGDPGSGKTTLIQYLAHGLCAADPSVRAVLGPMVPVPIILRELDLRPVAAARTWDSLRDAWLANTVRPVAGEFVRHPDLFQQLAEAGQLFFLVDGFDEVPLDLKDGVREAIWDGLVHEDDCRWLFTARIVGYNEYALDRMMLSEGVKGRYVLADGPSYRSAAKPTPRTERATRVYPVKAVSGQTRPKCNPPTADAPPVDIAALAASDSDLTRHFLKFAALRYCAPFDAPKIDAFASRWLHFVESDAKEAERQCRQFLTGMRERRQTLELAPSPVMLTFMALVYRSRQNFPNGREELYRRIVEAYLETIPAMRFGAGEIPLHVQTMQAALARVAWEVQVLRTAPAEGEKKQKKKAEPAARPEVLFPESSLCRWLTESLQETMRPDQAAAALEGFMRFLFVRTGLILPLGPMKNAGGKMEEHYAFLHLSVQEYLTAIHLHKLIADGEWQDEARSPAGAPSVHSFPALCRAIRQPGWHEVFYLLQEISKSRDLIYRFFTGHYALRYNHPDAPAALIRAISEIGKQGSDEHETGAAAAALLAAIATDPYSGLPPDAVHHALTAAWRWVFRRRKRNWETGPSEAGRLLARATSDGSPAWQALLAAAQDCDWIWLHDAPAITDIAPLFSLDHITTLSLNGCTGFTQVDRLPAGLQTLVLGDCTALTQVDHLPAGLQELSLDGCTGLTQVDHLPAGLQWLSLHGCTGLTLVDHLPAGLQWLYIDGSTGLTQVDRLPAGLRQLVLDGCSGLTPEARARIRKALPETEIYGLDE